MSNGYRMPIVYPENCIDHGTCMVLKFPNIGKRLQVGRCLGHAPSRGCVAYSGIDLETGKLLYITEWSIPFEKLESTCIANCAHTSADRKCHGHTVDDLLKILNEQARQLVNFQQKNIVNYECIEYATTDNGILLYLVREFVLGTSVGSVSLSLGSLGIEGVIKVAQEVLDSLIYLHEQGLSHNNLSDCTVFIDNSGAIRVTDFIPSVLKLIVTLDEPHSDWYALGTLIETISPTIVHSDLAKLIDRCKLTHELRATELLDHPFFRSSVRSRLGTELKVLQWLGKGAFGDVLKVRNILDDQWYAIKRIKLATEPFIRDALKFKIGAEVKRLSQLNHKNVLRYYDCWVESASLTENCTIGDVGSLVKPKMPLLKPINTTLFNYSQWKRFSSGNEEFRYSGIENPDDDQQNNSNTPLVDSHIIYIRMEYCEKRTLRDAIKNGLHTDMTRVWRLFRGITHGLSFIHRQGIIYRHLNLDNIFVNSMDEPKINDFGLGTTSFAAVQYQEPSRNKSQLTTNVTSNVSSALYLAPELTENDASPATSKVDMFSLGIVLFEMCHKPFNTEMERFQVITALRTHQRVIPIEMRIDANNFIQVEVLNKLLEHNPNIRPSVEQLLDSDLFRLAY